MPKSKSDNEGDRSGYRVPSRPATKTPNITGSRGNVPRSLPNSPHYYIIVPYISSGLTDYMYQAPSLYDECNIFVPKIRDTIYISNYDKTIRPPMAPHKERQGDGVIAKNDANESPQENVYSVKPILRPRLLGFPYQTEHTYLVKRETVFRVPTRKISKYSMTEGATKSTTNKMTRTDSIARFEKETMRLPRHGSPMERASETQWGISVETQTPIQDIRTSIVKEEPHQPLQSIAVQTKSLASVGTSFADNVTQASIPILDDNRSEANLTRTVSVQVSGKVKFWKNCGGCFGVSVASQTQGGPNREKSITPVFENFEDSSQRSVGFQDSCGRIQPAKTFKSCENFDSDVTLSDTEDNNTRNVQSPVQKCSCQQRSIPREDADTNSIRRSHSRVQANRENREGGGRWRRRLMNCLTCFCFKRRR